MAAGTAAISVLRDRKDVDVICYSRLVWIGSQSERWRVDCRIQKGPAEASGKSKKLMLKATPVPLSLETPVIWPWTGLFSSSTAWKVAFVGLFSVIGASVEDCARTDRVRRAQERMYVKKFILR